MTTDVRDSRALPEEGFHEIQLSGKQLVFLFMATTVVSVVIFLCGVLVGRGVRPAQAEPLAGPTAAADAGIGVASAPPAGATPAEGAASDASQPPTYYRDLVSDPAASESVKPADETAPAPEVSSPAPPAAEAASPSSPPSAIVSADARPASASTGEQAWTVQVTALRKRAEADAVAQRLVTRGYKAFVLDPQPGSTVLYRVRVGPFAQLADAEQTVKRLSSEEQFKPWISR
jgi:cell division septation protein DedD